MTAEMTGSAPAGDVIGELDGNWPGPWTARSRSLLLAQRIARLAQDRARRALVDFGLGFTEFEVLCALRSAPPPHRLLPSVLYDRVLISSGGLTKVLKALESGGLVERPPGEVDARTRPVALTGKGIGLVERAAEAVFGADAEVLETAALSVDDWDRLEAHLHAVTLALEKPLRGRG